MSLKDQLMSVSVASLCRAVMCALCLLVVMAETCMLYRLFDFCVTHTDGPLFNKIRFMSGLQGQFNQEV